MPTSRLTFLLALSVLSLCCASGSAQVVRNGEFEQNTDWWFAFGDNTIESTDDAFQGASAVRVTNRNFFWQGVAQSLDETRLVPGTDYHIQAWVKLPPGQSGIMGVLLYHNDDRGERALHLGEVNVGPDECCLLYTSPSPRDATLSRMPSSA